MQKIHITMHEKTHKMAGFQSVSTSVLENPICQARRTDPESVCAKCYADHLCRYRKPLQNCLSRNFEILNAGLLTEREALRVVFDTRYARIESFGDVASVTQARNYIRIIRANPDTDFGIWSKNAGIWQKAFELEGKPDNSTFVLSSIHLNRIDEVKPEWQSFVDHVFTVWSPDQYIYAGTPHECAGIKCRTCLKCYKRGTEFIINEKLR